MYVPKGKEKIMFYDINSGPIFGDFDLALSVKG